MIISSDLLAGMYKLPRQAVVPHQDTVSCNAYLKVLSWCLSPVLESTSPPSWCSEEEFQMICGCKQFLERGSDSHLVDVRFHAEYGCAVLTHKSELQLRHTVFVTVLGLDKYVLDMHTDGQRTVQHGHQFVGTPSGKTLLHVGQINVTDIELFFERFHGILSEAKTRKGDERSAANGKQGHQFTPALIHAVLLQAKACKCQPNKCACPKVLPKGGLTDNGLHTGGILRNTSFPLVLSILHWLLGVYGATSHGIFTKISSFVHLRVAENVLSQVPDGSIHHDEAYLQGRTGEAIAKSTTVKNSGIRRLLDVAKTILSVASKSAAYLHYDDPSVEGLLPLAVNLDKKITSRAEHLATSESKGFILPDVKATFSSPEAFSNLTLNIPRTGINRVKNISDAEIQRRIGRNIGLFPILEDPSLVDALVLRDWAKKLLGEPKNITFTWALLKGIELFLWQQAAKGFENNSIVDDTCVDALDEIVHVYCSALHELRIEFDHGSESPVELRSREVLVVWIAYCLIFATCKDRYSTDMVSVGVALDFHWLGQLVLSDRSSWEAVKSVAGYLASQTEKDKELFSLRNQLPTYHFAEKYAGRHLGSIWETENRNAEKRIQVRWNEILQKKKEAASLRMTISSLENDLSHANAATYSAQSQYDDALNYSSKVKRSRLRQALQQCKQKVSNIEASLRLKRQELETIVLAPEPILQPLPRSKESALQHLFFHHMPRIFRVLSDLTVTGRQLLIAGDLSQQDQATLTEVPGSEVEIVDYYNSQQRTRYLSASLKGSNGNVLLRSVKCVHSIMPKSIGSKSVDYCYDRTDGVWYPDELCLRMAWTGGRHTWHQVGGGDLNPFSLGKECIVPAFTEMLRTPVSALQVALRGPWEEASRTTRGNLVHAKQELKPNFLSKDQYIAYCTFRSFPNLQLRNIGRCLVDSLLPIGLESVQVLIRQALFQLGELRYDEEGTICLQWKRDMFGGGFFDDIFPIFRRVVGDLEQSPQNSGAAVFVGILSNFFSDFGTCHDDEFKALSRRFSSALFTWAEELQSAINASTGDDLLNLRARQCVLLCQSILCLSTGKLSHCDCSEIIKLLALTQLLCLENISPETLKVVKSIRTRCSRSSSQNLTILRRAVLHDTGILTEAVRGVIETTPNKLDWVQIQAAGNKLSTCFQAKAPDGNVFSLNFLTGCVLVNGLPPRSLPAEIVKHPLYVRVFGETNFEVFITVDEVFVSQRKINGCSYEFFLNGEELHVVEIEKNSYRFELLDGRPQASDKWGKALPVRLRRMHSHWLCRENGVLLFRGLHFTSGMVSFFLQLNLENWSAGEVGAICKCVPSRLRQNDWLDTVAQAEQLDTLALHSSDLVTVLQKFEDPDLIHFMKKAGSERTVVVEMPRLALSFISDVKGMLWSRELAGFQLSRVQQLDDTLYGFYQYLVLERLESSKPSGKVVCMVVIDGAVKQNVHHICTMTYSDSYDAVLSWSRFEVHGRFKRLEAETIYSRLQLASLHLGTTFSFVDKRTMMTGKDRAIELLRQCWLAKPYSAAERESLNAVWALCRGLYPCASLLCLDLNQNSEQVSFLHNSFGCKSSDNLNIVDTTNFFDFDLSCDDKSAYSTAVSTSNCTARARLSEQEECRVLGHTVHPHELPRLKTIKDFAMCPVSLEDVDEMERHVFQLTFVEASSEYSEIPPFPLSSETHSGELGNDFWEELTTSWAAYAEMSSFNISWDRHSATKRIEGLSPQIFSARQSIEVFLLKKLSMHHDLSGKQTSRSVACAFLQVGGFLPLATVPDLVGSVYRPKKLRELNPYLSGDEIDAIGSEIILWMRLCRLEDKVSRLQFYSSHSMADDLLSELRITSFWDASAYPCWLAFEVEGALQIRPEQFAVASHLIDCPTHIVQLQMGKGKTRVILPMLILHWTFHLLQYDRISRLNILSALIGEAYDFFHLNLTASVAHLKLFMMPFNRDIPVDATCIECLERLVDQCFSERGFFLVAPEHRLSLKLKTTEVALQGRDSSIVERLASIAGTENWRDILDESDELLHTRYQLIYAIGEVDELPGGLARYQAAQTVLDALLSSQWIDHNPETIMQGTCNVEAFPPLRATEKLSRASLLLKFRHALANSIVAHPPYELDWMKNHDLRDSIVRFLAEPAETTAALEGLPDEQLDDILPIRGYIAGDILINCLTKRHRVNYGIARGEERKRICVPFRGADTPSLRSEFAHPDLTIMLTTLSYYYDGLSEPELEQAFDTLLHLGQTAKQERYGKWFELSKSRMAPEACADLDRVEKLDLSNRTQFKHLAKYFSFNTRTISFWLNSCVFPDEMQQYPQRLSANSWHLAENLDSGAVGFSGTNDNHRNLPLLVKQFFPDRNPLQSCYPVEDFVWRDILSTNGRMLDIIIRNTVCCVALRTENGLDSLLAIIAEDKNQIGAIVDVGAILVGKKNVDVARKLLSLPIVRSRYRGVLFPDNAATPSEWKILEHNGRILRKANSPVEDHDAFAIFDEPRCRGSDLKLSKTVCALLTLGPGMCKDKFLQAAGRLRQLERGQKLIIAGSQDLLTEVSCGDRVVAAKHVLEWTVRNTIEANLTYMVDWANQGFFYCTTTKCDPTKCIEDEKLSPRDIYGGSFDRIPASKAVSVARDYHVTRTKWDGSQDKVMQRMIFKIMDQSRRFGTHLVRAVGGTDEECEREFELEREREEEEEIEIPSMNARRESDWDVGMVLHCESVSYVPKDAGVQSLADFLRIAVEPETLQRINWSGKVFGTRNFYWTVTNESGGLPLNMNHYLRVVDTFVRFPSDEILLLSEREADLLLEKSWQLPPAPLTSLRNRDISVSLCHLSFARTLVDGTIQGFPLSAFGVHGQAGRLPSREVLTELQLFAGETQFHERRSILEQMLKVKESNKRDRTGSKAKSGSEEPAHLVAMRGRSLNFAYSDLEKVCKKVAQDAGEGLSLASLTGSESPLHKKSRVADASK